MILESNMRLMTYHICLLNNVIFSDYEFDEAKVVDEFVNFQLEK